MKEIERLQTTTVTKESTPQINGTLATVQPSEQSLKSDDQLGRNVNTNASVHLCSNIFVSETMDYREQHMYLESSLLKLKPTVKSFYISRYCVATDKHFLCYSQEWSAYSPTFKPLIQLPYSAIEDVYK
jgi:hypothetical protein